jgi:ABC-type ATPase involved in cell division
LFYGSQTLTIKATDTRRITAAEMKYMRRTAGYTREDYKTTNCKGIKNNTNFTHITGMQEKLDTTCK